MKFIKVYHFLIIGFLTLSFYSCGLKKEQVGINNPIVKGDFADPSIVKHQGTFFIYATKDPWGGNDLAVLESSDFKHWEQKSINWPTKTACTSPTSGTANVWAPCVIKGKDGKFYMYVSVGNEIWAGVSNSPLGEWKNAKKDNSPLIKGNMFPEYHMIDAEAFIDDNGQAYLYWGSGLNWKNGHCFVVKLADDMVSFDEKDIKDITPPHYFEAPYMIKKNNTYYLMYSEGKCTNETYMVRYSISNSPYGPWKEGTESPILSTSDNFKTLGPGHHSVFTENNQDYILYHRIRDNKDNLYRELAIDSLIFNKNGGIDKVKPSGVILTLKK